MINATDVYDITFQSWWCDNGNFWSLPHSSIMASQKVFQILSLLYIMKSVVGQ